MISTRWFSDARRGRLLIFTLLAIPSQSYAQQLAKSPHTLPVSNKTAAGEQPSVKPEIDVWYGDTQRFGHAGNSQPVVNLLGCVSPAEQVAEAHFRVNGGRHQQIVLVPDLRRLANRGDFNLEIERSQLKSGRNEISIHIRTPLGQDVQKDVIVEYTPKQQPTLPFEIDFSTVANVQDAVEVIDGKWELTDSGLRTSAPYYDRQIAFGDMAWTDYELHAEVIFHRHFPDLNGRNPHGSPYLSHAHTSFNLRWQGHPNDGYLPRRDWMNLGSLVALRSDLVTRNQGSYWWLHFGRGIPGKAAKRSLTNRDQRFQIVPGERYAYRLRAKTLTPEQTQYSAKVWRADKEEPADWQMQAVDESEALRSGSAVFVVHHSDVTLARVRVTPIHP